MAKCFQSKEALAESATIDAPVTIDSHSVVPSSKDGFATKFVKFPIVNLSAVIAPAAMLDEPIVDAAIFAPVIVDAAISFAVIVPAAIFDAVTAPAAISVAPIAPVAILDAVIVSVAICTDVIVPAAIFEAVMAPSTIRLPCALRRAETIRILQMPLVVESPFRCHHKLALTPVDGIVTEPPTVFQPALVSEQVQPIA